MKKISIPKSAIIPLLSLVFISFVLTSFTNKTEKKLKVVIDAGHGGTDLGSKSDWASEKDINLKLVQELRKLNKNPKVELIFTRLNEQNISIGERAEIANMIHSDLLISIHCNFSDKIKLPVEFKILVPIDSNDFKSREFAKIFESSFDKKDMIREIVVVESPILLLKKTQSPSLMFEFSFHNTKENLKAQTNSKSLKKIAKSIYTGIESIQNKL